MYQIQRWDPIINKPNSINPIPGIYIIPDEQLLSFIKKHNFKIPIKITDTNSIYDNKLSYAQCQLSEYTGGYRPNFQNITNSIVVLPEIPWRGYPNNMGNLHILMEKKDTFTFPILNGLNNLKTKFINYNIWFIITIITIFITIIYLLYYFKSNSSRKL